eukprot:463250_1
MAAVKCNKEIWHLNNVHMVIMWSCIFQFLVLCENQVKLKSLVAMEKYYKMIIIYSIIIKMLWYGYGMVISSCCCSLTWLFRVWFIIHTEKDTVDMVNMVLVEVMLVVVEVHMVDMLVDKVFMVDTVDMILLREHIENMMKKHIEKMIKENIENVVKEQVVMGRKQVIEKVVIEKVVLMQNLFYDILVSIG